MTATLFSIGRIAVASVLLGAVIQFCHWRTVTLGDAMRAQTAEETVVVPKAETLKLFSLGYDQLVADCWWLAFIQYYGDTKARLKDNYKYAHSYLDLITQLDPKFTQPYWFAAFAVGAEMKRPDLAAQIIDRGQAANQDSWYLPFIAGINQYLFAHNDAEAAKYYRRAAKYPDAPQWLERQAVILEARVPSIIKEANTWTNIYVSTKDSLVKEHARQQLISLWIMVYRQAPDQKARARAAAELKLLGVDVERRQ